MDEGLLIVIGYFICMVLLLLAAFGGIAVLATVFMAILDIAVYVEDKNKSFLQYEINVTKNKYTLLSLEELEKYYIVAPERFKLSLENISYSTTTGDVINIMITKNDYGKFYKIFKNKNKKDAIFPENQKMTIKLLECVKSDVSKAKEIADEYLKESQKIMDEQVKVMEGALSRNE